MKRVSPDAGWPESWKASYDYDLQEIYGDRRNLRHVRHVGHIGYANAYHARRRVALQLLTEVLPSGSSILDVAAAQGNFSLALAELGYEVTWNDLRADLAEYVRLKYEHGALAFKAGNVFDVAFDRLFDGVLITEVIEHVAHPDRFLSRIATLVRPGGFVIMTTPNGAYFRNALPRFSDCDDPSAFEEVQFKPNADGHIFLIHPDELGPLAKHAGLTLDALRLFTNPLTSGYLGTERLLRVLPTRLVDAIEWSTARLPAPLLGALNVHMAVRFIRASWSAASTG